MINIEGWIVLVIEVVMVAALVTGSMLARRDGAAGANREKQDHG